MEYKGSEIEKKNRDYLLKLYIPTLGFSVPILIFFLVEAIIEYQIILFITFLFGIFLFEALFALVTLKWINQMLRKALQERSPEKLISIFETSGFLGPIGRFYNKMFIKIIPGWGASRASDKAIAYIYWAQFDQAKSLLQKLNWQKLPPSYQSLPIYIDALTHYLEKKDVKQGIKCAQEYLDLNQMPDWVPWKKWAFRNASVILDIGKVISDEIDTDSLSKLEGFFPRARIILKLPIAWALENAYLHKGETQKADQMRAFLMENAPYCIAFARDLKFT